MSDMRNILVEGAARLFDSLASREAHLLAEESALDRNIWQAVERDGYAAASRSEARGGDGADLGDALAIAREAGRHALPAPLVESLVAELALAAGGLAPRSGILTVGPVVDGAAPVLERARSPQR